MVLSHFCNRKILLIRHGRTDWNDAHRFQGHSDIPLNDSGMAQAEKLGKRLAGWPFDVVYTSPLLRARQTAEAVAVRHGKTPVVLEGLVEINFGCWEGLHLKSIREKDQEVLQAWLKDPFSCMPQGAETWQDIRSRVEGAVEEIFRTRHERIVIVSHGGIMRALYAVMLNLDPHSVWNLKTSNCAISGIEVREHQTSLAFSNDELHLKDIPENVILPVW